MGATIGSDVPFVIHGGLSRRRSGQTGFSRTAAAAIDRCYRGANRCGGFDEMGLRELPAGNNEAKERSFNQILEAYRTETSMP